MAREVQDTARALHLEGDTNAEGYCVAYPFLEPYPGAYRNANSLPYSHTLGDGYTYRYAVAHRITDPESFADAFTKSDPDIYIDSILGRRVIHEHHDDDR